LSGLECHGRVDQPGTIAALASLKPRVQIPPRPPRSVNFFHLVNNL
jgi:hypothetical protein